MLDDDDEYGEFDQKLAEINAKSRSIYCFSAAADLVEEGWCQGVSAVDSEGKSARIDHADAEKFCAGGALARVICSPNGRLDQKEHSAALLRVQKTLEQKGVKTSLAKWNDAPERTQEEVVELFRETYERVYLEML